MNLKPSERIKELFKGLDVHDPYRQRVIERQIEAIILYLDENMGRPLNFLDPITEEERIAFEKLVKEKNEKYENGLNESKQLRDS